MCLTEMQQPDSMMMQKEADLTDLFDFKGNVLNGRHLSRQPSYLLMGLMSHFIFC